ncbi:MAG: hypothetical protein HXY37_05705 [Chloroflexi bacterium]|nr:hypothetical protein [Chloroflexota bacterium]
MLELSQRERIAWLRALAPTDAVEAIVAALDAGTPEDALWATGALTACHALNNQARNLLGFVTHAMIGCEDARRLAWGQPAATRRLLIVQALYQVVCDLHDPCFAPYELLPFWPTREADLAQSLAMLRSDVRFGEAMRCDHRLVALEQDLPRPALIDLVLDIGLEGMITDDHTLITPVLALGMIELLGWQQGFPMLRWAVRYSASFPRAFAPYDRALALRERYGLAGGAPVVVFQPERVGPLRNALLAADAADRPEIAARALAAGHSPATVLAAVSLAGCAMYLMTEPVPHDDYDAVSREVAPMHIGTTTNVLRAALRWMRPSTAVLAAIQGGSLLERGPSVLSPQFEFVPFVAAPPFPYPEDVAPLRGRTPTALLGLLAEALAAREPRLATAAVWAYADRGADPEPLIGLLTAVACTDNGTLLHNFKHLHAMVEEFRACHLPERWAYLIAATRFIAWYAGKWTAAYDRVQALREAPRAGVATHM